MNTYFIEKRAKFLIKFVVTFYGLAFIVATTLTPFIQIHKTSGPSMLPTINQTSVAIGIKPENIKRGDIVTAVDKLSGLSFVKRVIGLPGETITYKNDSLYINNKLTNEPYLNDFKDKFFKRTLKNYVKDLTPFHINKLNEDKFFTMKHDSDNFSVTLDNDEYYLLGDDRPLSNDSRAIGPFQKHNIKSKIIYILNK